MGSIDERRRTSFDERAAQYDRARPGYPDVLIEDVLRRTGARRVLEVGAGTGQATRAFARAGCDIVALEPGSRLANLLNQRVAEFPGVRVERTTFEGWSAREGEFDLVLAAQSFHWIDPVVRYRKAARVARHLALLTNEVGTLDPDVHDALHRAYSRWCGGDGNVLSRQAVEIARRAGTTEIDRSGLYGPVHVTTHPWEATYDTGQYLDLIDTYSDHATLESSTRRGLYGAIASAIERHGGRLVVPYVAMAFVATRKGRDDGTGPLVLT